jgi:hypothetical protein
MVKREALSWSFCVNSRRCGERYIFSSREIYNNNQNRFNDNVSIFVILISKQRACTPSLASSGLVTNELIFVTLNSEQDAHSSIAVKLVLAITCEYGGDVV